MPSFGSLPSGFTPCSKKLVLPQASNPEPFLLKNNLRLLPSNPSRSVLENNLRGHPRFTSTSALRRWRRLALPEAAGQQRAAAAAGGHAGTRGSRAWFGPGWFGCPLAHLTSSRTFVTFWEGHFGGKLQSLDTQEESWSPLCTFADGFPLGAKGVNSKNKLGFSFRFGLSAAKRPRVASLGRACSRDFMSFS